jgi:hypothetical protein
MTNGLVAAARLSGLPVTEVGQGQPVAYLASEAVELRSAAVGRILLRVE